MNKKLNISKTKIKISLLGVVWLFRKWHYSVLALFLAFLFFELIYWLFNLGLIVDLLFASGLSIGDKISLLMSPFTSISEVNGYFLFFMMMVLSLIQGIALSALVYLIKNQPKVDPRLLGGSTFVSFIAIIGLGCPACGTSLVTPIVAVFFAGSAVAVSEKIVEIALPVAITIGIIGLYVIGLRLASFRAKDKLKTIK